MIIVDFIRDNANYGKFPDYKAVIFAIFLATIYQKSSEKKFWKNKQKER